MDNKDQIIAQLRAELDDWKTRHESCMIRNAEISKSLQMLNNLIDKSPVSIQIMGPDGREIRANKAHRKIFEAKPDYDFSIFSDTQLIDGGLQSRFERLRLGETVYLPPIIYNPHLQNPRFKDKDVLVRAKAFAVTDENNRPVQYVLMHENITERKRLKDELRNKNKKLRALYMHLNREIEKKLQILTRNLHDQIKQKMVYIQLDSGRLVRELKNTDQLEIAERISQTSNEIVGAATDLLKDIRITVLKKCGLKAGVEELINEFVMRNDIKCLSELDNIPNIPFDMATDIYRIIQLALINVGIHSKADTVVMKLHCNAAKIRIHISDNGIGIRPDQIESVDSTGIIGMRERTAGLKGKCIITGKQGVGTTIEIIIPLPKEKI